MGLVSALEHTSYLHPNGWLYMLRPCHAYLADHYGTLNIRALSAIRVLSPAVPCHQCLCNNALPNNVGPVRPM